MLRLGLARGPRVFPLLPAAQRGWLPLPACGATSRRWLAALPQPSAAPPAAAAPPDTWKTYLNPRALFARVQALGPTALGFYTALWVVPFVLTFTPVYLEVLVLPDPLVTVDHYLPFVGEGLRSTLGYLQIQLPKAGEPLPTVYQGVIWGFLANDLLEPPRLFAVLTLTPRLKAYLAGDKKTAL